MTISSELEEAITCMFSWYRDAAQCYVYIEDVSANRDSGCFPSQTQRLDKWKSEFRRARCFSRGWTLQELLALAKVVFCSAEQIRLGDKGSLESITHEITGIPHNALRGKPLAEFSLDDRLSWAVRRQTGRKEDMAYCLLGILEIHIPRICGMVESAYDLLLDEIKNKNAADERREYLLSRLFTAYGATFDSGYDWRGRIDSLVDELFSPSQPKIPRDRIFTTLLQTSIQPSMSDLEMEQMQNMRRTILGTIAVVTLPLSVRTLAGLLALSPTEIRKMLAGLRPIFNASLSHYPVRITHRTFREFLLDRKRCDADSHVNPLKAHKFLADKCLTIMSRMLKKNICGLGSAHILVKNVEPGRIERCISLELQYACVYWIDHYRQSSARLYDGDQVHQFFKRYFLH